MICFSNANSDLASSALILLEKCAGRFSSFSAPYREKFSEDHYGFFGFQNSEP